VQCATFDVDFRPSASRPHRQSLLPGPAAIVTPILLTVRRTGSASKCGYRAVVAGCECPESFRTVGRPKPLPTATLAKLCRKSVARQAFPIARGRCLIELLTSTGIPAAASFLVGTAPSKTLPHRQATFPLCALLLRANGAEAPPRPLRRHARSPCGRPTHDQNRPDGR
jgi:hypothetical protein